MSHFFMFVLIAFILIKGCNPDPPRTIKPREQKPKPQRLNQSWREESRMHWRNFVAIFGGRK